MLISDSLRLTTGKVVAIVGAGGKTSALFRLADELVAQDRRVILTTTTRLGAAQIIEPHLRYDAAPEFIARVQAVLQKDRCMMIIGEDVQDKVNGVPAEFIDALANLGADAILYEADGARRLPFKAPAAHEPVIAPSTTLLVPVIGATIFGKPLDDEHVHRAELAARLAGARLGEPVTPLLAARVIAHSQGGLKNKPSRARAIAFINQVETSAQLDAARELARLLLGYNEIDAVALGAAQNPNPIAETHRRVAAIILAGGAGARMAGRIKQLLPWRGKTLIENAIDLALKSNVTETLVVLGAHAESIRPVVERTPARIIINRNWANGQSTSIRAGVKALAHTIDAAIFINADQPLLTSQVVNTIVQRYRETDAGIIASEFAGTRGSPVLFDRKHFDELSRLTGEQGGRALLAQYPVERVEFADARWGIDVDTIADYEKLTQPDARGIVDPDVSQ